MDIAGINRRIAFWRERRGLTQEDFAALLGRSRSWVQKLEAGDRQADPRIGVLEEIARVLRVPLEALLAARSAVSLAECVDASEVAAIRDALQRHDVITGVFDSRPDEPPVDLAALGREVSYAWDAFQAAHYSVLGRVLPPLIVSAQRVAGSQTADQLTAFRLLSLTYQLASVVLMKFADATLAWQAADRGVTTAERAGDPLVAGAAARVLTWAMVPLGQAAAAARVSIATADRLHDELFVDDPAALSIYGMLRLKAAVATSETGSHAETMALITEAERVARRLGGDRNEQWTAFGPTNVALHRVAVLVQLGDARAAIAAAESIDPGALDLLPRERRAHHLVDLAHGYRLAARGDDALGALLAAESFAPQEVHCRPRTRTLIATMVSGVGAPSWRLQGLAARSGVPV